MTIYEELVEAEKYCHTIEIKERATGKGGVAMTYSGGVLVNYGNRDGSDDKVVSIDTFNRDFVITAKIQD